jgi:riboflavin kinase/FMN adenylyltransferase
MPVVTTGIFDGVHLGHQKLLGTLKENSVRLKAPSLVITFWPHPYHYFNPSDESFRLLMSLEEKKLMLAKQGIDHLLILPFDEKLASMSAEEFIKDIIVAGLQTRYLLVGDDHRFGRGREGSYDLLKKLSREYNFGLSDIITQVDGSVRISSTFIRSCLMAGDLASTNKLLGYNYFILGQVEKGNRLGSKIGFATANIRCCDTAKQIPPDGVYVVTSEWNGNVFGGMLNIGIRPTVSNTDKKSIEVHMFGHEGDLYDEVLKVSFVAKLRDEMRFNSLEELKSQLLLDKKHALSILDKAI